MALPQINLFPKYTSTIPSTGDEFTYRPFLVKEQKVLLIALESRDEKAILQSVVDTIESCTYEDIKVNTLATFDVEYMFTKIRSKSVGETTDINIKCNACEEFNELTVPLEQIKMDVPKDNCTIKLTPDFTLKMRYPSYKHLIAISEIDSNTLTEGMYEMIVVCLSNLQTEDENILFIDETRESIDDFLNNLNTEQFDLLVKFVTDLPKMSYDINFDCIKCTKSNTHTLQGMQDFF